MGSEDHAAVGYDHRYTTDASLQIPGSALLDQNAKIKSAVIAALAV
ncbi:MAG: hypothetical protein ACLR23_24830 [Clostridia bacterium]